MKKVLVIGCAMRGRYREGKIVQHLEFNGLDGIANCLTSVQKDSLITEICVKKQKENEEEKEYESN